VNGYRLRRGIMIEPIMERAMGDGVEIQLAQWGEGSSHPGIFKGIGTVLHRGMQHRRKY